jgi:Flp pilus assembly pilin Flp
MAMSARRPAKRLLARLAPFARSESGAAMVEFAIVALILFSLIFAMIDFGRALFLYNNLTNAAREGARFGATQFGGAGPCATSTAAIIERTASRIREFNAGAAANPSQYVSVTCTPLMGGLPTRVTVSINNYPFDAITPLPALQSLTLGTASIPISSVVRFEGAVE